VARAKCGVLETDCSCTAPFSFLNSEPTMFEFSQGGPAATPAAETSVVDLLRDPEPPANSAKHDEAAPMLAVERYKTFIPLALGDAGQAAHPSKTSGSSLHDFIASDIETMLPGVLRQTTNLNESSSMEDFLLCPCGSKNADDTLYSFCAQLHTTMMQEWTSTNTCLTREQLQNLSRGCCVHEEIADLLMGGLCGVLGASFDSSFEIHQGSKGRWSGHLKIDEPFSAKTLVLLTPTLFRCSLSISVPLTVSPHTRRDHRVTCGVKRSHRVTCGVKRSHRVTCGVKRSPCPTDDDARPFGPLSTGKLSAMPS
jgi:hypothetical protein